MPTERHNLPLRGDAGGSAEVHHDILMSILDKAIPIASEVSPSQLIPSPVAADTDGIHAAVVDNGEEQVITTGISNPDVPRNVTATAGGTAADVKAIQVEVEGTDIDDNPITETLPAFTVNTAGTVQGNKAFKTVTSFTVPAHDGTGATTALGFGEKLGLDRKMDRNRVIRAFLNGVQEATPPTVTVDADDISGNTADLNSALNNTDVVIDYY